MPQSRRRKPLKMPVGRAALLAARDGATHAERDVITVTRLSQRSFRWRIIDPRWRGDARHSTGTATTHGAAEKAAVAAYRADK